MIEFPHKAPKGYFYKTESFKSNVIAIWIHHYQKFNYNLGEDVRCIWGFYNSKTKEYFSPVNSKKVGKRVNIQDTTPYSGMMLKRTPLELAYVK